MKNLAVACILLCAALATAQPPKWTDRELWRLKLQPYMTTRRCRGAHNPTPHPPFEIRYSSVRDYLFDFLGIQVRLGSSAEA